MIVKTVFDREEGISEGRVSPASILHNSSLIMGKQIINILPEGLVSCHAAQVYLLISLPVLSP